MEKGIARESLKTKKARAKLQQKLDRIDQKMTKEALDKKSIEIHRWISRHAPNRVVLKTKTISLFDENNNTAQISQKISTLARGLVQTKS